MRSSTHATRMELLRLRRRLGVALRGYKLLKDKQDELMKQFMELIGKIREMREETEKHLVQAFQGFLLASAVMSREEMEGALAFPNKIVNLEVKTRRVMNLQIPVLNLQAERPVYCYGCANTSGELDIALSNLDIIFSTMIVLAEREKALELLAAEIEKTRRRVNALEYILIPDLRETIKYIELKLSELERSNLTRLMRIKEIIAG
ncbi:MAG: V-type ATP synthase subunit D [Deltaproteobacteria bacterium]|nr:MAG: V-type ATP synthase subunit D [Deltaproteobacteria bacterium]